MANSKCMHFTRDAAMVSAAFIWGFAGPLTYILCVVDTWHGRSSVPVKLLLNFTLDALAATFWPGAWIIWIIQANVGHIHNTPLGLLF
jgi:hypothetical protein